MKSWLNNTIYPCRKIGKYPQLYIERTMHGKYRGLALRFFEIKGMPGIKISMTNRMARLVGKRIEEALEERLVI